MSSTTSKTVEAYEEAAAMIWLRLSPIFGTHVMSIMTRRAIAQEAKGHPIVGCLAVSPNGLDWTAVRVRAEGTTDFGLREALNSLLDRLFNVLSHLSGDLIVGTVFQEADRLLAVPAYESQEAGAPGPQATDSQFPRLREVGE